MKAKRPKHRIILWVTVVSAVLFLLCAGGVWLVERAVVESFSGYDFATGERVSGWSWNDRAIRLSRRPTAMSEAFQKYGLRQPHADVQILQVKRIRFFGPRECGDKAAVGKGGFRLRFYRDYLRFAPPEAEAQRNYEALLQLFRAGREGEVARQLDALGGEHLSD